MFMAQEPHTPSRQERRKVSVGSMWFLIQIRPSSTIGPQSFVAIWWGASLGFFPPSGFQRYTLNPRGSGAPTGFGQVLPPVILEFFGSANSAILLTFRH